MEKTESDRRFRNAVYAGILLLIAGYGAYKFQMIQVAFEKWDDEVLHVDKGIAAK